ncbi:MAG: fumarylacetoacetate hydrolase family protein [Pseudomonadota bacterium]|nr:fumarylacetoacetate hydrolase family protein [Pseudomonadota bacterium]
MSDLAERLCRARLDGDTVAVEPAAIGENLDAAYALQQEVLWHIGDPSDSWKVGSTSAEAQAALGTTEPGAARVPARFCFTSPANVEIFTAHDAKLEAEFAFRLYRDLPPRNDDYTANEVAAATDGIAPSLEIVGSRLADGLAGAGRIAVTADGGANIALVTGDFITDWQRFDLPSHQLTVTINGDLCASGEGRRALGNPFNVMVWLANFQRQRDGLRAGEVVTTGTCSGLLELNVGDVVVADYGTLGAVQTTLSCAEG